MSTTRSSRISVIPKLEFLGKYSAQDQEAVLGKIKTYESLVERLQGTENAFNEQCAELNRFRTNKAINEGDVNSLLTRAASEIERLRQVNRESSLRLGMFDDIMSLRRDTVKRTTENGSEDVLWRIKEHLNK